MADISEQLYSVFGIPPNTEPYLYAESDEYHITMEDINRAIDSLPASARVNTTTLTDPGLIETIFEGIPKVGATLGETLAGVVSPLMKQLIIVLVIVTIGLFVFSKIKVKGLLGS